MWMAGLAGKLNDVMSALGGQSVIKDAEKENVQAGDYGYRYLVRACAVWETLHHVGC